MSKVLVGIILAGIGIAVTVVVTAIANYNMQHANHTENWPNPNYAFNGDGSVVPTCNICLNTMYSNHITQLHCGHTFHRRCFEQWLGYNQNTCPTCEQIIQN